MHDIREGVLYICWIVFLKIQWCYFIENYWEIMKLVAPINVTNGSFSDNFNFSMKKASRAYNFCIISKRHVVFRWQSVGQIKTRLKAQKYQKDWNNFIFCIYKCLKFLPSRFTVLVTHSITCIILPFSNIIICFKLSYPCKQTTE